MECQGSSKAEWLNIQGVRQAALKTSLHYFQVHSFSYFNNFSVLICKMGATYTPWECCDMIMHIKLSVYHLRKVLHKWVAQPLTNTTKQGFWLSED
jgi:hypothetical protein